MAHIERVNEDFVCEKCGAEIEATESGCTRNHCNQCLYSKHVDLDLPGDRASECNGLMKPIDVENDKKKGEMLMHVCERCGLRMRNVIASDDSRDEMVQVCKRKIY